MQNFYKTLCLGLLLAFTGSLSAQEYASFVQNYMNENSAKFQVSPQDVANMRVYNEVYTQHSKVTHVYALQTVNGVDVNNAIANLAIKDGRVVYASSNLEANIAARANGNQPGLTPVQAATSAATKLGLGVANFSIEETISSKEYILSTGGVSHDKVPVKLVYHITEDRLILAWDVTIKTVVEAHLYNTRIDASTGEILETKDLVVSCSFDTPDHATHTHEVAEPTLETVNLFKNEDASVAFAGEQYNVFALPVESPAHGNRSLLTDPHDVDASPFGWHDTDFTEGAEFNIARGNNVWARFGSAVNGASGGANVDGGDDRIFDFDLDLTQAPNTYSEAATTNLFYMSNVVHDVLYHYGFDEAAGNYQQTNVTGDGLGNDFVFADAQDSSDTNNANFFPSVDGSTGLLQMFLFSASSVPTFTVDAPSSLAGIYGFSSAGFGDPFPEDGLTGVLAIATDDDASGDEYDACDPLNNGADLAGKIAVVRRGSCNFTVKVKAAQDEGAIAVVVINNVPSPVINLGGDDASVTIPSGMISQADGMTLFDAIQDGEEITVTISAPAPTAKDGDFDNGIIAHEYGHGVSHRLAGGPGTTGCLGNAEQMGEGWSDYIGVILTIEPGDTGADVRGVGTYAVGQPITGNGIRPAAYSNDFAVNDLTYGDTNNSAAISQPHGIGSIWATVLWDMTWKFIDEYGFDEDVYNGTGGNNIALQLVMDGLKLQPCGAGFVSARDAIVAAVDLNDDITDEDKLMAKCMVWTAFANRGVGFSASQGSGGSRTDQVEAFDMPPVEELDCSGSLSLAEVGANVFKVYPNPSNGNININVANGQGEGTVAIYDINGRRVFEKTMTLEGTVNVNAQNLATGVYILKIDGATASHTSKLIIQ